mmetsp:Transcript_14497/g.20670  ORF Transcript_14497/g.20670 Transcript_14497/m.20670 type:complete len:195 (-) Transcript_14497:145-729(-)
MPPSTRRSLRSRKSSQSQVETTKRDVQKKKDGRRKNNSPELSKESTKMSSIVEQRPAGKNVSSRKKRLTVTFSNDTVAPASSATESSSQTIDKAATISARAQRSLRRQAKVVPEEKKTVPRKKSSIRKSTHSMVAKKRNAMKKLSKSKSSRGLPKSSRKPPSDKDEEVVTVEMNTGILYLYKGANRRAVFVRLK